MERGVKLWVVVVLLVLCNLTAIHGAIAVRLCGQKLVNIIKVLCNHKYVSPQTVYSPGYYSNQRQPRSGIVESCCWKQCTYSYLKSYCDDSESTTPQATTTESSWTEDLTGNSAVAQGNNHAYAQGPLDSSLHHAQQQHGVRRRTSVGASDVWHGETATITAAADTRRQVKTFRSLFHLLSYLSQFLSPVSPQSTTTQPRILPFTLTTTRYPRNHER